MPPSPASLIAEDPSPDAAAAARRLIAGGGAVAIVGAGTSSDTISAAEAHAIPRSVPMISPAATAPAITDLAADRGRDYLFRTVAPDTLQGRAAGTVAAERWATAAILHVDNPYGDKPPLPFVENAYDALALIGLAAFRALAGQPVTGSSVRDHLRAVAGPPGQVFGPGDFARAFELLSAGREIDYRGASGSVDFDAAGDVATSIEVWRFAGGGIEPLFTRGAQQPYCDYTPAATATPYVPD